MSARLTYGPCVGPDCGRHARYKAASLCKAHYDKRWRGDDLYPIGSRKPRHITDGDAALDIGEFEMLLETGSTVAAALVRLGMSGRNMQRRYQLAGRTAPGALHAAAKLPVAELRKRVAA